MKNGAITGTNAAEGIWVLVECSPGQSVYELTAASRSMFDDDRGLLV